MTDFLTPGQYMLETTAASTVQASSTSIGAFAGVTERGAFGSQLVTSFKDFTKKYGSYINNSYLAYAVKGFFDNGGSAAYISRVVHYATGVKTSAAALANIVSGATVAVVDAISDGTWGNGLSVVISNWSATPKTFDLAVKYNGVQVESYTGVTLSTLEDKINGISDYITVDVLDATASLTNSTLTLSGGNDGLTSLADADYLGDATVRNGIHAFDNDPINLLAVPGVSTAAVLVGIEAYCSTRRVSAILETPSAKTPTTALTFRTTTANLSGARSDLYYPWINVSDPIGVGSSPLKLIPPSGHIMGMFARTDTNRGVFKAPAGESDGKLINAVSLEYNVNDDEQKLLNPVGVNVIRSFPGSGIVVWGARTQAPASSVFKYIPVRRSVDFIEDSIMSSTRWTAFEPNNEVLWSKIEAQAKGFLRGFWKQGGLKGASESEAFYVICDKTTTTDDDIDAGKVFCEIGIATQKPAEFIVFSVQVR